jgi:spore coat protein U-like protein
MKRLILAAVVSAAALVAPAALAQAFTSGQFNVTITLNSACTLGAISDLTFTYTSLQGGIANSAGGGFSVSCTNGLSYTFGLEEGTTVPPTTVPGAANIVVTDDDVNLTYQLNAPGGGAGTGVPVAHTITGTMAAGQAGDCTAASCDNLAATNRRHTLIVNY